MVDRKYFYTSAFISVSLYVCIVLLLILYLKGHINVKKIDAMNKNTVLQLDVILEESVVKEKKINIKSGIKNEKIAKEVVKKTTSSSLKQKTNLKSLFADVKTSAKKIQHKKVSTVKKSTISSRFKSKFEKERKVKDVVLSKLLNNSSTNMKKVVLSESQNETDPYYSKIYQMLSSRWNPTIFSDNLKAVVTITIQNNGIFSFKFIQYSQNTNFNTQLENFLHDESLKRYPVSPTGKTTQIEITFQSKG
jgi:periplasmic protein TonB